ncbi:taurine catabolism dioxygenase tauD/tfdA [Cystobacter fuscus]|uniref:Taurine catabolism dioxygenase tauD/tfdA n=1 Tax=Cystobacter fuscus TaxID=43 RepID=A0A250JC62_9BACT|nr:TauD/TfdA family dioxygenase [Cystobacter fuscus]ATB41107.1 taurine catabolism dioxygenase tauD/tfdA [Cystobacter fuscus]
MSQSEVVHFEVVDSERNAPLLARCTARGTRLAPWVEANRELLDGHLRTHGAILFRGFEVRAQRDFEEFSEQLSPARLSYVYRSTPRSSVGANVYTATEYPPPEVIPLHCENAYQRDWPMKLMFYCAQPAVKGGATTLASIRRVTQRLGPELLQRFAERKVMYVRNYGSGVDLPWEVVFQTKERSEVERFCQEQGIDFEWKQDGGLRTRQVCQGVAEHPQTGETLWFNQAHLFHVSSVGAAARQSLQELFGEEGLPRNARFGDGSPIPEEVLEQVREAFRVECIEYPWQRGDVLLVDNMLAAHGRSPYSGPRRVLVAMSEPYSAARRQARA